MSENGTDGQGWAGNIASQFGGCLSQIFALVVVTMLCGGGFFTFVGFVAPFLVPAFGALLVGWLYPKVAPEKSQFLLKPVAAQGGIIFQLALALLVAALFLDETPTSLMWEVGAASAVLAWLVARPGVAPALLLILYNVFAVVVALMRFGAADAESTFLTSVLALLLYAGVTIYFLASVIGRLRRVRVADAAPVRDVRAEADETARSIRADVYASLGLPPPHAS